MSRRAWLSVLVIAVAGIFIWYRLDFPGLPDDGQTSIPQAIEGNGVRGLIVQPDDGRDPITSEIASARESIDIFIYIMTDSVIIDSLIDAERRGVEVRVIMDEHPYGGFGNPEEVVSKLESGGAETKWSSSKFTFTHAKTMLFDRRVVAILNLNLTRSGFDDNREFGVISTWPQDVQLAQAIFEADWDGKPANVSDTLVVSPDNSRIVLVDLIDEADESILMYAEVIRDSEIVDRLREAEDRGVEVQIILSPDSDPRWESIEQQLIESGVEVRISNDLYIHAKAIVVDGTAAYVGSQNFTMTSLDENREIGIVLAESALIDRIVSTFATDFSAATIQT